MRWRRKPLVVEAVQWRGDNLGEIAALVGNGNVRVGKVAPKVGTPPGIVIVTDHATLSTSLWGWVTREPSGTLAVYRAETFAAMFEPGEG